MNTLQKSKYLLLSMLLLLFWQLGFSQTKDEKESRIRIEAFPQIAQTHLDALPDNVKRIRYYKETDGDKESFETKFKYKKHWFSVEFDNSGKLEDIEVNIKKRELPKQVVETIKSYLLEYSEKFELIKIQEQYVFHPESSEAAFLNSVLNNRMTIASNYEIIIASKSDKSWIIKEYTFNQEGQFLNARNLQQDSYEYIMY